MSKTEPQKSVILLAAGLGKRMKSSLPKVLLPLSGEPLLYCVLRAIRKYAERTNSKIDVALVVGHQAELVIEAARKFEARGHLSLEFIHQTEQLGTGHAALAALSSAWGGAQCAQNAQTLVLPGDSPLITEALISEMFLSLSRTEALRLLTCELDDPTGYGRVVRKKKGGPVLRIVEEKDAKPREKEIKEVATSIYLFHAKFLMASLRRLSNQNAQKEYYLTDVIATAARLKKKIDVLFWKHSADVRGVNTPWELAELRGVLNQRTLEWHAQNGVQFLNPQTTQVDFNVKIGPETVVHSGAVIRGQTEIGSSAVIGPNAVIESSKISENVEIKAGCVVESSVIGTGSTVGPMAHLRPESQIGEQCRIGNFVELKKSIIGDRTNIAHLSYVGDAHVGRGVNIGCGFVTCNYDGRSIEGRRKHQTVIEDDVFIGSDCQCIAPIRVAKGAYVASGSTLTEDVPSESLAIARSRQVIKAGYAKRYRPEKS